MAFFFDNYGLKYRKIGVDALAKTLMTFRQPKEVIHEEIYLLECLYENNGNVSGMFGETERATKDLRCLRIYD